MMQLTAFAIAQDQKLPEGWEPKDNQVLVLSGILMQQGGTNKVDNPAIIIQLIDGAGKIWLAGTTADLFFDVVGHLKTARDAWDRGEAPPDPNAQKGKNPSDSSLN